MSEYSLSAVEVFQFFFGDRWLDDEKRIAMLCTAYIDDSSDGKQEKYVIACALIGSQQEWTRVFVLWEDALREDPEIKYFHSKEWRSLSGEFSQFKDVLKWPKPSGGEAANKKRDSLCKILIKSKLRGIAVSAMMPDYKRIREAYPNEVVSFFGKGPFEAAFQSLIFECGKEVGEASEASVIGFICDENQNAVEHTQLYLQFKKKNPQTAKVLAGIGHFDDKFNPGVQAADLMAHIVNQFISKYVTDGECSEEFPLDGISVKICAFKEPYALALLKANGVQIREAANEEKPQPGA